MDKENFLTDSSQAALQRSNESECLWEITG